MISNSDPSATVRLGWSYKTIQKTSCDLVLAMCFRVSFSGRIRFDSVK